MKHVLRLLFGLTTLFIGLAACDKIPQNGDLDGMWQLTEMTPAATGVTTHKKPEAIYWSFQLDVLMIHTPYKLHNGKTYNTSGLFEKRGDSLHVNTVYVHYVNRDSLISDPHSTTLDAVGIHGNSGHFRIESLSDSHMTLSSDFCRLAFRKI